MSAGHSISRASILFARRVGGPERDEWVRAMAAEWNERETGKVRWALGCLGAVLLDRAFRERKVAAAIALSAPVMILCNTLTMSAIAPALREAHAGTAVWMAAYLLNPIAVPFALGWAMPSRARTLALLAGGLFLLTPLAASTLLLGVSPIDWARFTLRNVGAAALLYPASLGIWVGAANLGRRVRLRRSLV